MASEPSPLRGRAQLSKPARHWPRPVACALFACRAAGWLLLHAGGAARHPAGGPGPTPGARERRAPVYGDHCAACDRSAGVLGVLCWALGRVCPPHECCRALGCQPRRMPLQPLTARLPRPSPVPHADKSKAFALCPHSLVAQQITQLRSSCPDFRLGARAALLLAVGSAGAYLHYPGCRHACLNHAAPPAAPPSCLLCLLSWQALGMRQHQSVEKGHLRPCPAWKLVPTSCSIGSLLPQWMSKTASRCSGSSAPCWRVARCRLAAAPRSTSPCPTRCPCQPCGTSCACAGAGGEEAQLIFLTTYATGGCVTAACSAWRAGHGFVDHPSRMPLALTAMSKLLTYIFTVPACPLQRVHLGIPPGGAECHPPHRAGPGRRRHPRPHDPPQHPPPPACGPGCARRAERRGLEGWKGERSCVAKLGAQYACLIGSMRRAGAVH